VGRYDGRMPSDRLLERVRHGELGGIILFGENTVEGPAGTAAAIDRLQRAARAGGTYPLLIMTDQEGGEVKRFADLPPAHAAALIGSAAQARAEGASTGRALRAVGVNVDLAPVADVEQPGGFLGTRSFGSNAATVADRACTFAAGLAEAGVAYTLKHFPGLGTADTSTDAGPVTVGTGARRLRAGYAAYRRCGHGAPGLVMVSSASYPRLTGDGDPALLSPETYRTELRRARVTLPTISDDLDTPAIEGLHTPALRALRAGLDLLLYAQTESSSAVAYEGLLGDLRNGSLGDRRVLDAAAAVARLKGSLPR